MKSKPLFLAFINRPEKVAALGLFALFLFLFILQVVDYWQFTQIQVIESPVASSIPPHAAVNTNAPLFKQALFGNYLQGGGDIKESDLDVELVGILYDSKQINSQVIIRSANGIEKTYNIGDALPGGAIIKQINQQGVVVLYNGALERLHLPKLELHFEAPAKPLKGE